MGGDRNESKTQLFSPCVLSLSVPGRCRRVSMASKQGESRSAWVFAMFGEISSYRI